MASIIDKYRKPLNNNTNVFLKEISNTEKIKKLKELIKDLESVDMMLGLSVSEKEDLEKAKLDLNTLVGN